MNITSQIKYNDFFVDDYTQNDIEYRGKKFLWKVAIASFAILPFVHNGKSSSEFVERKSARSRKKIAFNVKVNCYDARALGVRTLKHIYSCDNGECYTSVRDMKREKQGRSEKTQRLVSLLLLLLRLLYFSLNFSLCVVPSVLRLSLWLS